MAGTIGGKDQRRDAGKDTLETPTIRGWQTPLVVNQRRDVGKDNLELLSIHG